MFRSNISFKPKLNLDPKIQFLTNSEINFGLKFGLKPGFNDY